MHMALAGLLLAVPLSAAAADLSLHVEADGYAEPVSIQDFTHHWQGRFSGGRHAFLQGRAELTRRDAGQELGLLWRYDYLLDFTPDTAELYNAYAKGLAPDTGRAYGLGVTARYSEALGVRWSPVFQWQPGLTVTPGFNLLQGYKLTDGGLGGSARFRQPGFSGADFQGAELAVDYHYDEPQLYEEKLGWHPRNPDGWGYSLDLRADWRPDDRRSLTLQLYDVYGRLHWRQAPRTQYQFDYQAVPAAHQLTGQLETDDHYTQVLPMRGRLSGEYRLNERWQAGWQLDANRYVRLGQVSAGYSVGAWTGSLLWEPQTGALGVALAHPGFRCRWLADSLNTNRARRLGISLAAETSW